MSMLSREELWNSLHRIDDPLVITPILEEEQVNAASVDLRIGHQFIVLQRSEVTHIDASDDQILQNSLFRTQRKVRIQTKQKFVLHPRQLVLGATFEYVSIPSRLAATVAGRSSWGRLGLMITAASSISPGFKGCITLELFNAGEAPVIIRPGMRIAQLVCFETTNKNEALGREKNKYDCPTGPEASKIYEDRDMSFWS
jgi:dCTP deaminase